MAAEILTRISYRAVSRRPNGTLISLKRIRLGEHVFAFCSGMKTETIPSTTITKAIHSEESINLYRSETIYHEILSY